VFHHGSSGDAEFQFRASSARRCRTSELPEQSRLPKAWVASAFCIGMRLNSVCQRNC
jgi:hypothetical protein